MSEQRLRVYVAGPLSDPVANERERKVSDAMDAGIALMRAGFAPMIPHLTHFLDQRALGVHGIDFPHADWMAVDLPWLDCADAVLRLPGDSKGADMETDRADEVGIPVYYSVSQLLNEPPARRPLEKVAASESQPGHPGFHAILREIGELHARKAADYGRGEDPFANIRASAEFGVPAWLGAVIRGHDKVHRIKSFVQNGSLKNESVEDSLLDLASYAAIALALYREGAS